MCAKKSLSFDRDFLKIQSEEIAHDNKNPEKITAIDF